MLSQTRRRQVIELCQSLIQAKSYSGEEREAAEVLEIFFRNMGFADVLVDKYGSCLGHMKGCRPGPHLLFDGHLDTVPVTDLTAWSHDPFGAEIVGDRIYGRGASDMKGALAAMAAAAAFYARDTEGGFPGEIYVAGTVYQEYFEGVAAREISVRAEPDYVIIGEASGLDLRTGQRGRAEIVVEAFGSPAHSANPEKGLNAVYKMCRVIERIKELPPNRHPVLGQGILELTDIISSPYPGVSVVPDYCRATFDRRLLTGETKESILGPIKALLDEMMAEDPTLAARTALASDSRLCYTGQEIRAERFFPGWLYGEDEDFIQAVYREMAAGGHRPCFSRYNVCTNGSHYAGEAGLKTLGLGPSRESQTHTIDEYIEISQLLDAVEAYMAVMRALLK